MALTLIQRAGVDTLAKLEDAAPLRYRDANALRAQGQRLGAIYMYGYSVEIRLKVAYYRTIGLVRNTTIDANLHRRPAEGAINVLPLLPRHTAPPGPSAGHHVVGWARLLEQARAQPGHSPLSAAMAATMHGHAMAVFDHWAEFLRYRANRPRDRELRAVAEAARWFDKHAGQLWR